MHRTAKEVTYHVIQTHCWKVVVHLKVISPVPSTIDGWQDGAADTAQDLLEEVKNILVESAKENTFRGGELVKIKAIVIAYNTDDQVDFYYTSDAANPIGFSLPQ